MDYFVSFSNAFLPYQLFNVEALRKGEKKYYDHKVDIYSFSLVLWELLTNETPFKGRNTILVAYAVANVSSYEVTKFPSLNCLAVSLLAIPSRSFS